MAYNITIMGNDKFLPFIFFHMKTIGMAAIAAQSMNVTTTAIITSTFESFTPAGTVHVQTLLSAVA